MNFPSPQQLTEAIPYELMHVLEIEDTRAGKHVQLVLKRIIDVVGAVAALIVSLPLMALITIGLKCTSKGPVLFKQTRVGYCGKKFAFLKFRTMHLGAVDQTHREYMKEFINGNHERINMGTEHKPIFKMTSDARITSFGRLLRKTSLDELPQFFNVLAGDMSLVGPRPEVPLYVSLYSQEDKRVLELMPGITDPASIKYRQESEILAESSDPERTYIEVIMPEKIEINLAYAQEATVLSDFKVVLETLRRLVR